MGSFLAPTKTRSEAAAPAQPGPGWHLFFLASVFLAPKKKVSYSLGGIIIRNGTKSHQHIVRNVIVPGMILDSFRKMHQKVFVNDRFIRFSQRDFALPKSVILYWV